MFTGLVRGRVPIDSFHKSPTGGAKLVLPHQGLLSTQHLELGASIAINGCCLTLVEVAEALLYFELSGETLDRSSWKGLKVGDHVHLEGALTLADPLGGHLLSGHVDGCGSLLSWEDLGHSSVMRVRISDPESLQALAPYLVQKGSVAVDGVSLTVNKVIDGPNGGYCDFEVALIPHTLKQTRFQGLPLGAILNLEADMMAKYAARHQEWQRLAARQATTAGEG